MQPMLGDLALPQVQEITDVERRALAEFKVPALPNSVLQNLGRRPTRLALWGVATGPTAAAFVGKLTSKFRAAKPLAFTSDIVADAHIDTVLITDMRVEELAGKPQRYAYVVTLAEYIEPTKPAEADLSSLDPSILADAANAVGAMTSAIAAGQAFASGLAKFIPKFTSLLSRVHKAQA